MSRYILSNLVWIRGVYQAGRGVREMYSIGDKIVHPMHGAGIVDEIREDRINGVTRTYYIMRLPYGGMTVMIPTATAENIGVRDIITSDQAEELLRNMCGIQVEMTTNWNKRYRVNMLKIKSGDLMEVAEVIKGLMARDAEKGLSTGERKMLHSAKQILVSELVLAQGLEYAEVEKTVDSILGE